MDRKEKILIVEDEENIREELREYLSGFGYEVSVLTDFSDAAESALREHPDLILMDVNIPGMNGIAVCERIRKSSQVPVIFVTANDTPVDELECIMRGGDDYVAKPYRLPILTARIAAVLRRMSGKTQGRVQETTADVTTDAAAERMQAVLSSPGKKSGRAFAPSSRSPVRMEHRGVILDIAAAQLAKGDRKRELTKNELKILYCLYQHPGEIVSRMDILDYLWDNEVFIDDNTLSVHITRIRNKLKELGVTDFIETKRGMGYRI